MAGQWAGHTLELVVAREQRLLVAIRKAAGNMEVVPTATSVIEPGDVLIVVGEPAREGLRRRPSRVVSQRRTRRGGASLTSRGELDMKTA